MRIVPTTFRFDWLSGCALAAVAAAQIASASAATQTPAAHKHRQSVTPQTRDADPSTTATIPLKAPSQKALSQRPIPDPTAPDNDALPPPFHLPTASRERMRDCGLKWQAMKASGEAGEEIWRDFATRCLAAESGPLDKRSER